MPIRTRTDSQHYEIRSVSVSGRKIKMEAYTSRPGEDRKFQVPLSEKYFKFQKDGPEIRHAYGEYMPPRVTCATCSAWHVMLPGFHEDLPSKKNAIGHPTACFIRVQGLQKMLSRFHTKNPKRKVMAPVLRTWIMAAFFLSGIVREASDQ